MRENLFVETWPADDIETLCRMWREGAAGKAIADALGGRYTRSAVIGKANRLKDKGVLEVHSNSLERRIARGELPPRKPAVRAPVEPERLPLGGVALVDLQRHHCRFPLENLPPFSYCGNPKHGSSSYCEFHRAMCSRTIEPSKPKTEPSFRPYTAAYR